MHTAVFFIAAAAPLSCCLPSGQLQGAPVEGHRRDWSHLDALVRWCQTLACRFLRSRSSAALPCPRETVFWRWDRKRSHSSHRVLKLHFQFFAVYFCVWFEQRDTGRNSLDCKHWKCFIEPNSGYLLNGFSPWPDKSQFIAACPPLSDKDNCPVLQ